MTLSHIDFQTVFNLDDINVLVVEDPKTFTKYCKEVISSIEEDGGDFCLFENEKLLKMGKRCVIFSDLLCFEMESKKITNKLLVDLKNLAETEYATQWYKLKAEIYQFLSNLNSSSLYPLEYDEENDISALLKVFNVRLLEEENSLLEKLVSYIKVSTRYLGITEYFFVNLKCFLSAEEVLLLYKEAALESAGVFLLENTLRDKLEGEKILIIDKDLCEIVV